MAYRIVWVEIGTPHLYEGNWMNLMMVTGYSGHWRLGGVQLYRELSWDDLALHVQHGMGNGQTYGSQIRLRTALP